MKEIFQCFCFSHSFQQLLHVGDTKQTSNHQALDPLMVADLCLVLVQNSGPKISYPSLRFFTSILISVAANLAWVLSTRRFAAHSSRNFRLSFSMKEMFGEQEGFHAYLLAEVDYVLHTSSNKSLFFQPFLNTLWNLWKRTWKCAPYIWDSRQF